MNTTWKTKDGRIIPIRDMSDQHLANTIRMLERCAPAHRSAEQEACMGGCAGLQSEMAQYAAEQGVDEMFEESPEEWLERQPTYKALVKERKRRKKACAP